MLKEYIDKLSEDNQRELTKLEKQMQGLIDELTYAQEWQETLQKESNTQANIFSPRSIDQNIEENIENAQRRISQINEKIEYMRELIETHIKKKNEYIVLKQEIEFTVKQQEKEKKVDKSLLMNTFVGNMETSDDTTGSGTQEKSIVAEDEMQVQSVRSNVSEEINQAIQNYFNGSKKTVSDETVQGFPAIQLEETEEIEANDRIELSSAVKKKVETGAEDKQITDNGIENKDRETTDTEFEIKDRRTTDTGIETSDRRTTGIGIETSDRKTTGIEIETSDRRTTDIGIETSDRKTTGIEIETNNRRTTGIGIETSDRKTTGIEIETSDRRTTDIGIETSDRRITDTGITGNNDAAEDTGTGATIRIEKETDKKSEKITTSDTAKSEIFETEIMEEVKKLLNEIYKKSEISLASLNSNRNRSKTELLNIKRMIREFADYLGNK